MKHHAQCHLVIQPSQKFNLMNPAIEQCIRKYTHKLTQHFEPILNCTVWLDVDEHLYRGKKFHVSIRLRLPNTELMVNRNPSDKRAHEDIYVALRDGFEAAKHQLQRRSDKLKAQRHRCTGQFESEEPILPEAWMRSDLKTISQTKNSRV